MIFSRSALPSLMLLSPLFASVLAFSAFGEQVHQFAQPQQREVFEKTLTQINCPKCSGQSIAESSSAVAAGLRQLVFELVQAGHSEAQIKDRLRQSYGEEILRQPTSVRHLFVLWGIPLLFLAGGLLVIAMMTLNFFGRHHQYKPHKQTPPGN